MMSRNISHALVGHCLRSPAAKTAGHNFRSLPLFWLMVRNCSAYQSPMQSYQRKSVEHETQQAKYGLLSFKQKEETC